LKERDKKNEPENGHTHRNYPEKEKKFNLFFLANILNNPGFGNFQ